MQPRDGGMLKELDAAKKRSVRYAGQRVDKMSPQMTQAMMFATGQMPALKGNALSVHARRYSQGVDGGKKTTNSQTQLDVMTSENDEATLGIGGAKKNDHALPRVNGRLPSDRNMSPSTGFRLQSNYKNAPSYPESVDYNAGAKMDRAAKRGLLNNTMLKSGATIMNANSKGARNSRLRYGSMEALPSDALTAMDSSKKN